MTDPSICQCGGKGFVDRNERIFECECAYLRRRFADMPQYIRKADVRDEHVLQPPLKLVRKSLFISAAWPDMKAIVKLTMIRHRSLFLKVTSDREILDVYLGKAARMARAGSDSKSGAEGGDYYNSLQELMDPPDLCLVRLNETLYKNKAAPSVLEEALSYRLDRDRPTWVLSDLDRPFGAGSTAYSEGLEYFIHSSMTTVKIPRIVPRIVTEAVFDVEPVRTERPKPPRAELPPRATLSAEAPEGVDESLSQYGSGLKKKSKFGRK